MSYEKNKHLKQARLDLIQQALDEINNDFDKNNFSRHAFYVIAKFGLQLKAIKEGLFTWDIRIKPELNLEEFKIKIKEFLFRHIK